MFALEKLKTEHVALYGAGSMGLGIAHVLMNFGVTPVCFCDKKKTGTEPNTKLPIVSPKSLYDDYADATVIVTSPIYAYQIEQTLNDLGFEQDKILSDLECLFGDIPDDEYLKAWFKQTDYELNLENPQTFNEKIQWLKRYDRKPIYTTMADKLAAKNFIRKELSTDEYIVPTLGVWDSFDEIDFDSLPEQFVLKCNHDCGGVVLVPDKLKLDKTEARNKLTASLNRNYFWGGREWAYKDIKPRIFAEKYLGGNIGDYKFCCFNGTTKSVFTCTERTSDLKVTFFDTQWNKLNFIRKYPTSDYEISKPTTYDKMDNIAKMLSKEATFLRVDFFECKGKLYVGELTFYPGNGAEKFNPIEWDYTFGSWMELTIDKK